MSVITNRGQAAKESANQKNIDFKKLRIKLADGDSIRVRVPSVEEYVEYMSHGEFNLGIYTQPCILPLGSRCAFDEAMTYINDQGVGKDDKDHPLHKFRSLYAKKRYMFAFYDIDEKMIRLFDGSVGQATKLISDIEQYKDSLEEIAFTFKRTGEKTATVYSLSPILKLNPTDTEKFNEFDGVVDPTIYDKALMPRTFEEQIEELRKAGFPVADAFGDVTGEAPTDPTQSF